MSSRLVLLISHRGIGVLEKYIFQFSSAFVDTALAYHMDQEKGRWPEWLTARHVDRPDIMLAFSAGDYGAKVRTGP